jgi:hypothetical protein
MKASRIFWGSLFLSLGVLFFLKNAFERELTLPSLWRFWPLLIIVVGLLLMIKQAGVRAVLAGAAGLWLGWLIYFVATFGWLHTIVDEDERATDDEALVQEIIEPLPAGLQRATLHVSAAVGKFTVDTTSSALLDARIKSSLVRYELNRTYDDSVVHLRLEETGDVHVKSWCSGEGINTVAVGLSTQPEWDMSFEVGGAHAELDLRELRLTNLSVEAGAASVRMMLGVPQHKMHCKIKAGASTLKLSVPESVGCEIRFDGGFSSKRFEGFHKIREKLYRTDNYETADRKISIVLDAGLSALRVERY